MTLLPYRMRRTRFVPQHVTRVPLLSGPGTVGVSMPGHWRNRSDRASVAEDLAIAETLLAVHAGTARASHHAGDALLCLKASPHGVRRNGRPGLRRIDGSHGFGLVLGCEADAEDLLNAARAGRPIYFVGCGWELRIERSADHGTPFYPFNSALKARFEATDGG